MVSERLAFTDWLATLGDTKIAIRRGGIFEYCGTTELDKIVIQARVDRERALVAAMRDRDIKLRDDSEVVKAHVMTGERTIAKVCDIEEEMAWYFCRGYRAALTRFPVRTRSGVPCFEQHVVLDAERMRASEDAKDVVVRSKLSYTDGVMPDNLPLRVAARFERIMAEPDFESRSPWDDIEE